MLYLLYLFPSVQYQGHISKCHYRTLTTVKAQNEFYFHINNEAVSRKYGDVYNCIDL